MDKTINELVDEYFDSIKLIDSKDIPNIDLYMDQVTTFMDSALSSNKRNDDEKVLTKTMINNYAKNSLLPSPNKKKYNKDHIIILILIYYLKNVLSINDIKKILDPITEEFFSKTEGITLSDLYDGINANIKPVIENVKKEISLNIADIKEKDILKEFLHIDDKSSDKYKELLEKFYMIIMLTFDISIKKQIVESIIDSLDIKQPEDE